MNVALHGMEAAAGLRYRRDGGAVLGCPLLVRYADDVLALCHSRQQAEEVQARLAGWLAPRGLAFNQDKTRITHLDQGWTSSLAGYVRCGWLHHLDHRAEPSG